MASADSDAMRCQTKPTVGCSSSCAARPLDPHRLHTCNRLVALTTRMLVVVFCGSCGTAGQHTAYSTSCMYCGISAGNLIQNAHPSHQQQYCSAAVLGHLRNTAVACTLSMPSICQVFRFPMHVFSLGFWICTVIVKFDSIAPPELTSSCPYCSQRPRLSATPSDPWCPYIPLLLAPSSPTRPV